MIRLPSRYLAPFEAFTCYNSPYAAHDAACAIDLYLAGHRAISPVAGEVVAIHRIRAPRRPYAREFDYVVAIDTDGGQDPIRDIASGEAMIARILHLDPTVDVGEVVSVGQQLGTLVRAGFFAPWVGNHLHVGFRGRGDDLLRAGGSRRLALDVEVAPIHWDGHGAVVAAGRTYLEIEPPASETDGDAWVGLASDEGWILDGGLPHYPHGGLVDRLTDGRRTAGPSETVHLLGSPVGTASGSTIDWADVTVRVNGKEATGISLFCARSERYRIKIVFSDHNFAVGDEVTVSIEGDISS